MAQDKALRLAAAALVGGYVEKVEGFSCDEFLKTGVDPFRFALNVAVWGLERAIKKEIEHKIEMALENLVGDFHEYYLGNTKHHPSGTAWKKLPRGQTEGIDIVNEEKKYYFQIKSKHNSMNSSSAKMLAQQLAEVKKGKPGATVGCGWVIARSTRACIGERNIASVGKCLKGKEVYGFVTGNDSEMDEVLDALPKAIKDLAGKANFDQLLTQAVKRVQSALEERARARGQSVIKYLCEMSVD